MSWQQWLYVIFTTFMGLSLYGFLWYLYGSREVGRRIERRGELIFHEEPLEPREHTGSAA
ncbi:MAG: hypothetical protein ACO4AU_11060 [bacterium]|jgi:cbb3-type cytochrome oxidase subunit 3